MEIATKAVKCYVMYKKSICAVISSRWKLCYILTSTSWTWQISSSFMGIRERWLQMVTWEHKQFTYPIHARRDLKRWTSFCPRMDVPTILGSGVLQLGEMRKERCWEVKALCWAIVHIMVVKTTTATTDEINWTLGIFNPASPFMYGAKVFDQPPACDQL